MRAARGTMTDCTGMGGAASVVSGAPLGVDDASALEGVFAAVVAGSVIGFAASAGVAIFISPVASSLVSMPECGFPATDGVSRCRNNRIHVKLQVKHGCFNVELLHPSYRQSKRYQV